MILFRAICVKIIYKYYFFRNDFVLANIFYNFFSSRICPSVYVSSIYDLIVYVYYFNISYEESRL